MADQLSIRLPAHIEVLNQWKDGFEEYDVLSGYYSMRMERCDRSNEILRNAACAQLDTMYPEPQEEYLYLDEDYPYPACQRTMRSPHMERMRFLCGIFRTLNLMEATGRELGDLRTRVTSNLCHGRADMRLEDALRLDDDAQEAYW